MNYFELVNKCLLELNYKQVESFKDLYKGDHKRILENLNRVNFEVCSSYDWLFLQQKVNFSVPAGEIEIPNPCDGKIKSLWIRNADALKNGSICHFGAKKLKYLPDYEAFYALKNAISDCYSCFEDKILIAPQRNETVLDGYFISNQYALNFEGIPKEKMDSAEDTSIIPMPYAEHILVYGACMKLKGNPDHNKFKFWFSLYNQALANLRSRALYSVEECPKIKMRRGF